MNFSFGYKLLYRSALASAVLAVIVLALLAYDYVQRGGKDPVDALSYMALKRASLDNPNNEVLKKELRDVDARLREDYFRHRTFTAFGGGLLLASLAVFFLSLRGADALRRTLPPFQPDQPPDESHLLNTAQSRRALLVFAGVVLLTFFSLSWVYQGLLPTHLPNESETAFNAGKIDPDSPSSASQKVEGVVQKNPLPTSVSPPAETHGQNISSQSEVQTAPPPATEETKNNTSSESSVSELPPIPSHEEYKTAWPRFRGPHGNGVVAEYSIPQTWNVAEGKNVLWQTPIDLPGNSSVIVWKDHLFVTGADEKERALYCLNGSDGKLMWKEMIPSDPRSGTTPPKVNEETGFAAPTPATNGRDIFAFFANGDMAAFDFAGKLRWSKSFGPLKNVYGHAASLCTFENLVLVQLDQGSEKDKLSRVFALSAEDGKEVWSVPRPVPNSWSSPLIAPRGNSFQFITAAAPLVISYDPKTGKELWRADCLKGDIGPSPVFAEGRIIVANEGAGLVALPADGEGNVTSKILWHADDGIPDTCSPLAGNGMVFLLTSYASTLTCFDAEKGENLWSEDFEFDSNSSPSLVGQNLFLFGKDGKCAVLKPGREGCEKIAENDLGDECTTSPAFQEGRLFIRTKGKIVCISKKD